MDKAPFIGIRRLRIGTDGHGITTLVGFHGCPLQCQYCMNPQCHDENPRLWKTPDEVMEILKKDELYFRATKGGVTFGGGEPLLWSQFIIAVLEAGAKQWQTNIETSLNVPIENLSILLPYIDEYIIDVKDMDSTIYETYAKKDNQQVKDNLRWLINHIGTDHITVRIPLIPDFNDVEAQERSRMELIAMGITRFDTLTYKTNKQYNYERKRQMRIS